MNDWNSWRITYEDRCKHDEIFQSLRPVNGFITGEQARVFFTQYPLAKQILAQIWALADITVDGKLDRREFSIAMNLISRCREGSSLPPILPPLMLQDPQKFVPEMPPFRPQNNMTNDNSDWSISDAMRPKYKLEFNQNDRNKRGYLTGVEARGIFIKSGLSQPQLAAIWNLADVDKDGNLTCEEFCIAAYLIDQVKAGRTLPSKLPISLDPVSLGQIAANRSKSALGDGEQARDSSDSRLTFEDKRMQNYLLGQSELEKRRQVLAEQKRQEEEMIRQEQERDRQRRAEAEAEAARAHEARAAQASAARLRAQQEEALARAQATEAARVAGLRRDVLRLSTELSEERARLDRASAAVAQRNLLSQRATAAQAEMERLKTAITMLASQNSAVEAECCELTERLRSTNDEIAKIQREEEMLQRQLSPSGPAAAGIGDTAEQQKTLRNTLKHLQESRRTLETQMSGLETEVLLAGKTLASHRQRSEELSAKRAQLSTEVSALQATLMERRKEYRQKQKTKETEQALIGTTLDAGPSETYVALYAYTASRSDELTFAERDKIQIFTNPPFDVCEGWLYGEMNGRRGLVPGCYVEKASDAAAVATSSAFGGDAFATASSIAAGVAAGSSGTVAADPFPSTNPFPDFPGPVSQPNSLPLMQELPTNFANGSISNETNGTSGDGGGVTNGGEKVLFTCLALYNFEAKMPGDLSLQANDRVDVFEELNGWYRGVSQRTRERGLFPANHVQKLQPDTDQPSAVNNPASAFAVLSTSEKLSVPAASNTQTLSPSPAAEISQASPENRSADQKADSDPAVITVCETPELAVVETPFTAQSSEQLSLSVGQYVKIRKHSSKGWWEGEIQQRGQDRQIGWFPADCVKVINASSVAESQPVIVKQQQQQSTLETAPATSVEGGNTTAAALQPAASLTQAESATSQTKTAASADLASASVVQALFPYRAAQPDELSFPEGAVIEVLAHEEEEGWWRGRIRDSGVEGLFPVNYVKPFVPTATAAAANAPAGTAKTPFVPQAGVPRRTQPVIQDNRSTRIKTMYELIETEHVYLRDLVDVRQNVYEGLKQRGVNERKLEDIFGAWKVLCEISEAFYKDLHERKGLLKTGKSDAIADIMVRHLPQFMKYRLFLANQDSALENLQGLSDSDPEVAKFLASCARFMGDQSMPVSSYFIKPMQRITRYKLFIEKLIELTPAKHPDRRNLEQSLDMIKAVLDACNEAKRGRERCGQFSWLKQHIVFPDAERLEDTEIAVGGEVRLRLLVYSGTLFKVKSKRELVGFLFTDMLLLTQPVNMTVVDLPSGNFTLPMKPDESLAKVSFKAYRRSISLAQIQVKETPTSQMPAQRRRRSLFRSRGSFYGDDDNSGRSSRRSSPVDSKLGGAGWATTGRQGRLRLRPKLSTSTGNLTRTHSTDTLSNSAAAASDATSFVISDHGDPSVYFLVRAPNEELRNHWMQEIERAAAEYREYLSSFRNSFLSTLDNLGVAVLTVTVVSASNLPMVGPNKSELPWPYCDVSLCLRSKRTNIILNTRSPQWNFTFRFLVRDISRDVVTLSVYNKSTSLPTIQLAQTEVEVSEIARKCQFGQSWRAILPLTLVDPHTDDLGDSGGGDEDGAGKSKGMGELQPATTLQVVFELSEKTDDIKQDDL